MRGKCRKCGKEHQNLNRKKLCRKCSQKKKDYSGQWVALNDSNDIVVSAKDVDGLMQKITKLKNERSLTIAKVPEKDVLHI
jgi:hypothetical protein